MQKEKILSRISLQYPGFSNLPNQGSMVVSGQLEQNPVVDLYFLALNCKPLKLHQSCPGCSGLMFRHRPSEGQRETNTNCTKKREAITLSNWTLTAVFRCLVNELTT